MKKYLILTLSLAFIFALALPVFAAVTPLPPPAMQAQNMLNDIGVGAGIQTSRDLPGIIALIINVVLGLLGVIFLVLTVYAGFLWMTAREDKAVVENAQKILKNAVIGLIITLAAYAISNFVITNIVNQL